VAFLLPVIQNPVDECEVCLLHISHVSVAANKQCLKCFQCFSRHITTRIINSLDLFQYNSIFQLRFDYLYSVYCRMFLSSKPVLVNRFIFSLSAELQVLYTLHNCIIKLDSVKKRKSKVLKCLFFPEFMTIESFRSGFFTAN